MLTFIFWTVVLSMLAGSAFMWTEERRIRRGEETLIQEVTAYLSKRRGPL